MSGCALRSLERCGGDSHNGCNPSVKFSSTNPPTHFGRNKRPRRPGQDDVGWGLHLKVSLHQNLGSTQNIRDKVTGVRNPHTNSLELTHS